MHGSALVGIVMGSDSDLELMKAAAAALAEFDIPFEVRVLSAHRATMATLEWAHTAVERGLRVIIAGAGGAAHLPGVVAAATPLPVIGVPVPLKFLDGMDSLLSMVQMPGGIPVATVAIGNAKNAGILAARILGTSDTELQQRLVDYQSALAETARTKGAVVRQASGGPRRLGF